MKNNLLTGIIALSGGGGTAYITWEKFFDTMLAIGSGIIVTVVAGVILHYLLPHIPKFHWWRKKDGEKSKSNGTTCC